MKTKKSENYLALNEMAIHEKLKSIMNKKRQPELIEESFNLLDDVEASSISSPEKNNEESFLSDLPPLNQTNISMNGTYWNDMESSFIINNISKHFSYVFSKMPKSINLQKEEDDNMIGYKENIYQVA